MGIENGAEQSTTEACGIRKIIHIDMDAFYRFVTTGEPLDGVVLRPA
jgi:hypothetical protein